LPLAHYLEVRHPFIELREGHLLGFADCHM
jgi:hypothetical protein